MGINADITVEHVFFCSGWMYRRVVSIHGGQENVACEVCMPFLYAKTI